MGHKKTFIYGLSPLSSLLSALFSPLSPSWWRGCGHEGLSFVACLSNKCTETIIAEREVRESLQREERTKEKIFLPPSRAMVNERESSREMHRKEILRSTEEKSITREREKREMRREEKEKERGTVSHPSLFFPFIYILFHFPFIKKSF